MDRTSLPRVLSGGYIEEHRLDVGEGIFAFRVEVLNDGVLSSYEVSCQHVSLLEYRDEQRGAIGERVQLTELWIENVPERSSSEEWELLLSLWDLAHVRIRCGSVVIDGVPLR